MASYGERFAELVGKHLRDNRLVNTKGQITLGKINSRTLADLADKFERSERLKDKKERTERLSKGELDRLFDALAAGCGMDIDSMTEPESKLCGISRAQIVRATPDVTTEEIEAACRRYRREMPGATISPKAVANNWSKLFDSTTRKKGSTSGTDTSEPKVDWSVALKAVATATADPELRRKRLNAHEEGYKWYQLSWDLKRLILIELKLWGSAS
jgi:hypothetical protein